MASVASPVAVAVAAVVVDEYIEVGAEAFGVDVVEAVVVVVVVVVVGTAVAAAENMW